MALSTRLWGARVAGQGWEATLCPPTHLRLESESPVGAGGEGQGFCGGAPRGSTGEAGSVQSSRLTAGPGKPTLAVADQS